MATLFVPFFLLFEAKAEMGMTHVVYPLIYHSIPDEVPEASRGLVNRLYQLWLALLPTLVVNFIACVRSFLLLL